MRLVLITGLDGSGKSSLLQKLEDHSGGKPVGFLRVPKIDAELFKGDARIYKTCLFINFLHNEADHLKQPSLKAVALFSAMIIFRKLLSSLSEMEVIFCERHPLIDTAVYARFYSDKMNPDMLPRDLIEDLDEQFASEISFLRDLIPGAGSGKGIYAYLAFIHQWFAVDKKNSLQDLKELFKVDLPERIIYLAASPEMLISRLAGRTVLEPHESLEVFKKLVPVYDEVLLRAKVPMEKINAELFSNIDSTFLNIKRGYFPD